jgi:hypothetical protein
MKESSTAMCLQKCDLSHGAHKVTSFYKCDGAFTFRRLNGTEEGHLHGLLCEGAMFSMTESEKINEDGKGDVEGDATDVLCPGGKCATGAFCLADSMIIAGGVKFTLPAVNVTPAAPFVFNVFSKKVSGALTQSCSSTSL